MVVGLLCLVPRVLPAQGLAPHKAVTQYILDGWTTDEGLPQNSVNAIVQTRDGYLWLGTYEGLARFDGVRFTVFNTQTTDALKDNVVHVLLETRDGALWIGTQGGGLSRLQDGQFTAYTTAEGLSHNYVTALHEDRQGALWIGTQGGGVSRLQDGQFTAYTTAEGLANDAVQTLLETRDGALWIGTQQGLSRRQDGRFTTYTTAEGLSNDVVRALYEDRDGALWIGTRGGGLNRFAGGGFTHYTTREGLSSDEVIALREDRYGALWIGTYGGGLNRLKDGAFEAYTAADGLSDDVVWALYEDREGSLWIGTLGGGVNRLKDGRMTTYTTHNGLSNDATRALLQDREGTLWIGTQGGLNRFAEGRFMRYTTAEGLANDFVWSLYQDRDGVLWIGTVGGGLSRFQDGRFTAYTTREGLANDFVRTIAQGDDGSLWIGTDGGGLSRLQDGRFTTYTTDDGLTHNVIRILYVSRDGALWIGTRGGGLNRLKDGVFEAYTTDDGLSHHSVTAIYEDPQGTFWIGTYGGGLNRLVPGEGEGSRAHLTAYTTKEGLFDNVVHQILEDAQGRLWMSSNKGIFRVDKQALNDFAQGKTRFVPSTSYSKADGMKSTECNGASPAGVRNRDGTLWFPTVQGVVAIDPESEHVNTLAPPVVIEQVVAGSDEVEVNVHAHTAVLPPRTNKMEFHYTGLSFLAPEKVRFRYRLDGSDEAWVEAGTRRAAYYTNLPPGDYTFHVLAANNDGVWNEEGASFSFYLKPHFYETSWFYLLLVLALIGAGVAGYRLRVRRLEQRNQMLEQAVEERTREIRLQAEEIRQQKEIAEEARSVAEDASAVKTHLLSIAAHDLKNPLNGTRELAKIIKEKAGPDEHLVRLSDLIVNASNRMLHLVTELLASAALDSGEWVLHKERVDMKALAATVVESNRPQAQQKGQPLVFSPEADGPCVVDADPDRLQAAMDNLVSNAIKYSPPGKTVRVSVRPTASTVLFSVRDEGPGLTDEDRQHLFRPFQRLSARPTGNESSTGLGLSIVKKLVDLHAGQIRVESAVGRGSTFTITLPRPDDRAA